MSVFTLLLHDASSRRYSTMPHNGEEFYLICISVKERQIIFIILGWLTFEYNNSYGKMYFDTTVIQNFNEFFMALKILQE